jgi:uncharacterized protein YkwD
LAKGHTSAADVVQAWMKSPSHRENMLHWSFREIGIGRDGPLWVLHFGMIKED